LTEDEALETAQLSYAMGWADDANYRANINTELLDVVIHANSKNGVRIDSAPFAIEPDFVPDVGNGCLERVGQPAAPLHGPVMDSEMEDTDPVCEHVTGFRIHSTESEGRTFVKYNLGWGILVGRDDQDQNIYAFIGTTQMYENLLGGIRVHQNTRYGTADCDSGDGPGTVECRCDDTDLPFVNVPEGSETVGCTATTILSNNVFNNGGPGLFIRRSQQKAQATEDRRVIASNFFHHNAVSVDGCTDPQPGFPFVETFSQVHFEGPVILTDPDTSDAGLKDGSHPADLTCYLGLDHLDPPLSETQCDRMNDPEDVISGGVNNHCMFTGNKCRIAWVLGGTSGTGECGASDNSIYAYINDDSAPPYTQKGVVADDGAFVLARRNTWGVGGADNGTFATSNENSEVDFEDACSTISQCTPPSPPPEEPQGP
jgi:hypothetical protein